MKTLILNSGLGSRMGVLTSEHPNIIIYANQLTRTGFPAMCKCFISYE